MQVASQTYPAVAIIVAALRSACARDITVGDRLLFKQTTPAKLERAGECVSWGASQSSRGRAARSMAWLYSPSVERGSTNLGRKKYFGHKILMKASHDCSH